MNLIYDHDEREIRGNPRFGERVRGGRDRGDREGQE